MSDVRTDADVDGCCVWVSDQGGMLGVTQPLFQKTGLVCAVTTMLE